MLHRIEPGKQQQAGEKSADMRLPRHRLIVTADRQRDEPEHDVHAEPDDEKQKHA